MPDEGEACIGAERSVNVRREKQLAPRAAPGHEAASAWAAQFDNLPHWYEALSELAGIIIGRSSGSGSTTADRQTIVALRKRWDSFLTKHESEIRKGRVFKPGEPDLPEDLFAPHREIHLEDGTHWPSKK